MIRGTALRFFFGDRVRATTRPDGVAPTSTNYTAIAIGNVLPEPEPPPISIFLETPRPLKTPPRHVRFLPSETQVTVMAAVLGVCGPGGAR